MSMVAPLQGAESLFCALDRAAPGLTDVSPLQGEARSINFQKKIRFLIRCICDRLCSSLRPHISTHFQVPLSHTKG
jgi:hypothetical protein